MSVQRVPSVALRGVRSVTVDILPLESYPTLGHEGGCGSDDEDDDDNDVDDDDDDKNEER